MDTVAPPAPAANVRRMNSLLAEAARLWVAERGPLADGTLSNGFLLHAEHAWRQAGGHPDPTGEARADTDPPVRSRHRRPEPKPPKPPTKAGWLYKCFDDEGRLTYVGIGRNPEGRWKAHREAWGEQAIARCVKVREYDDYATLRAAEVALIAELQPPLNHDEVDR